MESFKCKFQYNKTLIITANDHESIAITAIPLANLRILYLFKYFAHILICTQQIVVYNNITFMHYLVCTRFSHIVCHMPVLCNESFIFIHPIHRFKSSDWLKEDHMTWISFDNVHAGKLIHVC